MGAVAETIQNPLFRSAAVTTAEALGIVAFTTMYNHRELTHDSIKLRPALRSIARTAMRAIGMNPYVWASVHTVHHATPDANLVPIIETADYLEWRASNPSVIAPPVPETFVSLDPVAALSPEQVKDIGGAARQLVEDRYDAPSNYSMEDTVRLLDPSAPRYFYDERPGFLRRKFSKSKVAPEQKAPDERSLAYLTPELRDPHSPALHRKGVRGVMYDNVQLYSQAGEYFRNNANRPAHLQQEASDKIGEYPKWGQRALIVGNIAIAGAIFSGVSPVELGGHVLAGHVMTGLMATGLRFGGNLTNSFGHGGKRPWWSFIHNKLLAKEDGTFATNAKSIGQIFSLDEVGGQGDHHDKPGRIAYSSRRGAKKLRDAPFGSILEFLSRRKLGMSQGSGFGLGPNERRPDEPTEAWVKLQEARILTMAGEVLEKTAA